MRTSATIAGVTSVALEVVAGTVYFVDTTPGRTEITAHEGETQAFSWASFLPEQSTVEILWSDVIEEGPLENVA